MFINLLHPKEHFYERVKFLTTQKEERKKKKTYGKFNHQLNKSKNKALPMKMLPETMGPLEELQLPRDNNRPQEFAGPKYYIIAILAEESLFTRQLHAKPSVTTPGFPWFADTAFTFQEEPLGRKGEASIFPLEQLPFYISWEGEALLSLKLNPTIERR